MCILQQPIFDANNTHSSSSFNFHSTNAVFAMWIETSITQALIAINRLLAMRNSPVLRLFTRRACLCYISGIFPVCLAIMTIFNYEIYSITYDNPDETTNYLQILISRPTTAIGYVIPVICYILIFIYVVRTRMSVFPLSNELLRQQRKETWKTLQFALIFFFYLGMTGCYSLMNRKCNLGLSVCVETQKLIPKSMSYLHSTTIFFATADQLATGLVQGIMNQRIRNSIRNMLKWNTSPVAVINKPITSYYQS
ncbi:melatonin receptor type 1A [Ditylenchus destructor]|nr:melatonin receptor type 1A [Ditylenchus destructor]